MVDHLAFIAALDNPPFVQLRRGDHWENQRTHDALLRRELIVVDAEGYTHLTRAGVDALTARPVAQPEPTTGAR
jgi:hypothetical protein